MHDNIEEIKQKIKKLEEQLKRANSILSLLSGPVDEEDIKEKLFKNRMVLATLYKTCHQYNEAFALLDIVYDDLELDSDTASSQYIDVLEGLVECTKALNKKVECTTYLSELFLRLSSTPQTKYKEQIIKYLKVYKTQLSAQETIDLIDLVLQNLDSISWTGSKVYSYAMNLKIKILSQLKRFEECYTCLNILAEHQSTRNNRININNDALIAHLNAYSLACIKGYSIKEFSQKLINSYYQKMSSGEEVFFEPEVTENKLHLIKIAFLFNHLKVVPPSWFPPYKIQKPQAQFLTERISQMSTDQTQLQPLSHALEEEVQPIQEPAPVPEYIKIREKITLAWDKHGVAGYSNETQSIVEQLFIPRSLSPKQLEDTDLKLPRGGILYGPPGTGKTLIARTIANDFIGKENVTVINGPALISKYVGQSAENLRSILDEAKKKPGVTHVVIIDEMDALVCSRDSSGENLNKQIKADLTTTLLTYLDGVDAIENLMIIGLTNYFERLDEALIRPGRLDVHINIGLPNYKDRLAILRLYLCPLQKKNKVQASLDIEMLAKKSEGLSGAGIKAFIDSTMKQFGVSQLVSFDNGKYKIEDSSQIIPLNDAQFLFCLDDALKKNRRKKTEQELLQSRVFCPWNDSLKKNLSALLEKESNFAYLNPMIVNVTGKQGTGTTSCALNLFPEQPDKIVYMKAGELVNLSPKDQEKYIDDCFYKALNEEPGVLIIDNIEDITSCHFNPRIYLREKLKMPLDEGETLKVVMVSKNEESVQQLFNGQIVCDETIRMPAIIKKAEISTLIKSLKLDIDIRETHVELTARLTIKELKNHLLTFCNRYQSVERTLEGFLNYVNSPLFALKSASNVHRIFNKNQTPRPANLSHKDDCQSAPSTGVVILE
ncbi:AAA family ATPase [Legionella quinlivanii]|uniref:AAA family ATPase n=1 Tax=Legionella quinlivanii TaxID=45073 RepID=UPI002243C85A|nr:ATP-binding protein [Legionella quinlivanii]MCW8451438.1 ATP-binding protein [Legionella quinlivanii]